ELEGENVDPSNSPFFCGRDLSAPFRLLGRVRQSIERIACGQETGQRRIRRVPEPLRGSRLPAGGNRREGPGSVSAIVPWRSGERSGLLPRGHERARTARLYTGREQRRRAVRRTFVRNDDRAANGQEAGVRCDLELAEDLRLS